MGAAVGDELGAAVGDGLGAAVGDELGAAVGDGLGAAVGDELGAAVGDELGIAVGAMVGSQRAIVIVWESLAMLPALSVAVQVRIREEPRGPERFSSLNTTVASSQFKKSVRYPVGSVAARTDSLTRC